MYRKKGYFVYTNRHVNYFRAIKAKAMDENSQGKMMVPVKIYGAEGIDEWEISGYLSEFCLTDVAISIVVIVFENLNSLKHKPTQLFPFSPIS